MNHAPSEDLHNSLLTAPDLAFVEEIHKKASHDQIGECYDELKGCQMLTEVSEDYQPKLSTDTFLHPTYHRFYPACIELFPKLFVFSGKGSKFDITGSKFITRFIIT